MPTEEFERLKEALKKPPTPEAMKEAGVTFRRYRTVQLGRQRGSKPTLVSLGLHKPYPTSIPVDKIADELERSPAFFEHMRDIVSAEEE